MSIGETPFDGTPSSALPLREVVEGSSEQPTPENPSPNALGEGQGRGSGAGIVRVLLIAGVGALLVGFAAFAANSVVKSEQPIARTMCMDTTCTYPMSVDGATAHPPPPKHTRSAPERLVRKILYICHIR